MVDIGTNWKCPYCGHAQVLDAKRVSQGWHRQYVRGGKEKGYPTVFVEAIQCANAECRELSLKVALAQSIDEGRNEEIVGPTRSWTLLPPSSAKPQPDCVPGVLRNDYYEACAIRDLSPKASATIIRRCLQGMIRDFCGINKPRLIDEINELRERVLAGNAPVGVQPDAVEAIDHVRNIGNIGAHMEADINVIIDVDPDEAQLLIELTELLFDEWYVARDARTGRLAKLKSIADDKKKKQTPDASPTQA